MASERLDNRMPLYGDSRLTDAQVIALRGASTGRLRRTPQGWFIEGQPSAVHEATLRNLTRRLAIEITGAGHRQTAATTPGGDDLLRKIDEALVAIGGEV